MTPYGVQAYLPYIDLGNDCIVVDIFCINRTGSASHPLYLFLRSDESTEEGEGNPRLYYCLAYIQYSRDSPQYAPQRRLLCPVEGHLDFEQWKEIYISPRPPYRSNSALLDAHERLSRLSLGPSPPFRIRPSTISSLQRRYSLRLTSIEGAHTPWTGHAPVRLYFSFLWSSAHMVVVELGRCTRSPVTGQGLGPHYVVVGPSLLPPTFVGASHDCAKDHVTNGCTRVLKDGQYEGSIIFKRSVLDDPMGETLELLVY